MWGTLPSDIVSHPRRLESAMTLLEEPQISRVLRILM